MLPSCSGCHLSPEIVDWNSLRRWRRCFLFLLYLAGASLCHCAPSKCRLLGGTFRRGISRRTAWPAGSTVEGSLWWTIREWKKAVPMIDLPIRVEFATWPYLAFMHSKYPISLFKHAVRCHHDRLDFWYCLLLQALLLFAQFPDFTQQHPDLKC